MYYKRARMWNERFVIQNKHAILCSINLSIPSKPKRAVIAERKFPMDLWVVSSLHEYSQKCSRYAKLGQINEIISAAKSSPRKRARV